LAHGIEQILGKSAAFEDRPHECEEGDRQQQLVGGDAVNALRQRLQQYEIEMSEIDRKKAEAQPYERKRERDRVAEEEENDKPREHQRGHDFK